MGACSVIAQAGRIDVLVNSAGVTFPANRAMACEPHFPNTGIRIWICHKMSFLNGSKVVL